MQNRYLLVIISIVTLCSFIFCATGMKYPKEKVVTIKFTDTSGIPISKGIVILIKHSEEFQFEYDKHEKFRRCYVDRYGIVNINYSRLRNEYCDGHDTMFAYLWVSKQKELFMFDVEKDTTLIRVNKWW